MKLYVLLLTFAILGESACDIRFIQSNFFVALINTANKLCRLYDKYVKKVDDLVWNTEEIADDEYDFIIVGSGSGGSVLANRLSEIPDWKVLILEAGEPETELVDIPLLVMSFQGGIYDWSYHTEKQPTSCLGLKDEQMLIPRGLGLGGSTLLNYMIYSRGSKYDFDKWERNGNKGWSYQDVLPYFLKSEGAHNLSRAEWKYHNRYGPLSVQDTYKSLLVESVLSGGPEIGLPYIDYNAPVQPFGVSNMQSTTLNGKRFSVAKAYLKTVAERQNLHIVTSALATKVLIQSSTKKAYGVEYEKNGKKHIVRARKEVLLSAGAVNTPQLLMISGVGPKDHLAELGIPCLKDLPVGKNLLDHLTFYGVVFTVFFDWDQTTLSYMLNMPEFVKYGRGPYNTLGGVEAVAFVKTNESTYEEDMPDIEWLFMRGSLASDHGKWMKSAFNLKNKLYEKTFKPLELTPTWTVAPVLLHQESKGEIKLNSTNPHDHPLIYANYFTDPGNKDIKRMIAGIRMIERLAETKAFRSNGAKLSRIPVDGCAQHEFDSDAYWECALRSIPNTLYHQMGTCKMGPKTDKGAVVDDKLRVYGVKGLRVVDASVIDWISGHTNAVTVMIGEKASDMIKEEYGKL